MTARPLISVIIPVFNGAAFLGDAIRSVLAQNYEPLEIIVVDDGSTDDALAAAASVSTSILYYRQDNAGPPSARNYGLSMAKGDIIALLDADDLFLPGKFAQQLMRLDRHPECDIIIGRQRYESLDPSDGSFVLPERPNTRADLVSLQLGCGLYRRRAFDRVGRFNVSLRHCDDWDWFLRAREIGVGMLLHRDIVLRQRLHGTNITRQREEEATYQRLVFKLSLDRRRAQGRRALSLPPLASFLEPLPSEAGKES
jgi:glycosyltransferase involved in cell wall biosynthesis